MIEPCMNLALTAPQPAVLADSRSCTLLALTAPPPNVPTYAAPAGVELATTHGLV